MSQFRKLRYPDAPKAGPAPQVQCSTDSSAKSVTGLYAADGVARQIGAVTCAFVEKGADGFPTVRGLEFGDLGKYRTLFKFIPPKGEKEPRLASIEITATDVPQSSIIGFLERIYGAPVPVGKGVTMRSGLNLPDETREWTNASSSITLRKVRTNQQNHRVVFEHTALTKIELEVHEWRMRQGRR
ncbi:hypothetical protein PY365_16725 [Roseiarcaceae bacterium H3SJ34-1]|uniref:hypothetical protein n=1 Tax=Terripilifer ovatus TaxID=3032367 RepID=UPI003AB95221|nr:hypothetical protein [Roseiarcaceae bacterium H3SJ34-1]